MFLIRQKLKNIHKSFKYFQLQLIFIFFVLFVYLKKSSEDFHQGVSTFEFMEESVKLIECKFAIVLLFLVSSIENFHFQMDTTFAIALNH